MDILKSPRLFTLTDLQRVQSDRKALHEENSDLQNAGNAQETDPGKIDAGVSKQDSGEAILTCNIWKGTAAKSLASESIRAIPLHNPDMSAAQLLNNYADYILASDC